MTKRAKLPHEKAAASARRRANRQLAKLITDKTERDTFAESVDRYVEAVALSVQLRDEWERQGRPPLAEGSMRQPIPHPLVKMIQEAEKDAARFGEHLGLLPTKTKAKRAPGRPAGAESAPDRKAPPRVTRLQAVK